MLFFWFFSFYSRWLFAQDAGRREKKDFIPWYPGYVIRFAIKYVNVNNYNNTLKKFLAAEN